MATDGTHPDIKHVLGYTTWSIKDVPHIKRNKLFA